MKRHSSLAILSREHHDALILAQLLKKGAAAYKGLPTDLDGKAAYAGRIYKDKLKTHFEEEEQVVIRKIKGTNADLDKMAGEITEEHKELRSSFEAIKNTKDLAPYLDKLGHALEQHIRKEERNFFPLIQELCSEQQLTEIEKELSLYVTHMKKDIENREDVKLLINRFYDKVKADPLIGFIFNDVMKVNWELHLPRMYDFWENTLFYIGGYTGNPMEIHRRLNQIVPLSAEHFQQWTNLFTSTVDEIFSGEKAELAKQRALSISTVMQIKILQQSDDKNKIL